MILGLAYDKVWIIWRVERLRHRKRVGIDLNSGGKRQEVMEVVEASPMPQTVAKSTGIGVGGWGKSNTSKSM